MTKFLKKYSIYIRSVFIFVLFWFSSYFQWIPVKLLKLDVNNLSFSMKVILSTFSSFLLFFILFFVLRKDLKKEFKDFRKHFMEYMDIGFRWWMIGLGCMFVLNAILIFVLHFEQAANEQLVQKMIKAIPVLMLLDAGVLAPFNEEIVFRKSLKDVFGDNKYVFIFLSFLLFGGAHVIGSATCWQDYLFLLPYGALGAGFAVAYVKTNSVFTSMSMHMIHNIALILLSMLSLR